MIPGSEPPPSDSNPASVQEPAAAQQQHEKDDDEHSGRVHFLSFVFLASAALCHRVHWALVRNDSAPSAARITPTPMGRLTAVQAGVCSLVNTQ
jgi:hypothetical protein